jgi:hypothetical protein
VRLLRDAGGLFSILFWIPSFWTLIIWQYDFTIWWENNWQFVAKNLIATKNIEESNAGTINISKLLASLWTSCKFRRKVGSNLQFGVNYNWDEAIKLIRYDSDVPHTNELVNKIVIKTVKSIMKYQPHICHSQYPWDRISYEQYLPKPCVIDYILFLIHIFNYLSPFCITNFIVVL